MFKLFKNSGDSPRGRQDRLERQLEALSVISRMVDADYKTLCESALSQVVELTDSRYGMFGSLSQDESSLTVLAWSSQAAADCAINDRWLTMDLAGGGLWAEAVRRRRSMMVNDYSQDIPHKIGLPPGHVVLRRVLAVPIVSGGRVVSLAMVANKQAPYNDQDAAQVMAFFRNVQAVMERQRVSEALRQSQAELERQINFTGSALEALTHPFYVVDINSYEVLMANRAALTDHPGPSRNCYALVRGLDEPCEGPGGGCPLEMIRKGATSATVTHRHQVRGQERVVEVHAFPIFGQDERPGTVILYSLDVTGREQAQQELRRSKRRYKELYQETRRREEMYQSLLNSMPDSVVIYDLGGMVRYVNPAFTNTFGYSLEEVAGRKIPFVPEGELERTASGVGRVLQGESIQGFETKRHTKEGRMVDVVLSSSCYYGHDDKPDGIVVVLHDVTHRRSMEDKLRQAQKMEAVGTLASGIAHDFNNILQIIYGFVQRALTDPEPVPRYQRVFGEIEGTVQRAGELVQRLLTFSRQVPSELIPTNLNHLVFQAVKILERTIPKMIVIEPLLAPDLGLINADGTQMQQVLMNLGANAKDAMDGGGRLVIQTGNLELDQDQAARLGQKLEAGSYVHLSVRDTGIGMDADTLSHVFDPFFTTKGAGQGTGMGLATVYGVVMSHGGAVTCQSRPGQGAAFDLYFPRLAQAEIVLEPQPQPQPQTQAPAQAAGGSESLLLVDDEPQILGIGAETLNEMGYATDTAASGEDALACLGDAENKCALVILDLNMPGMGGLAALAQIKQIRPGQRVLVSSGYAGDAMVKKALAAGADGFLEKPYRLSDLLIKVRQVLDLPEHEE